MPTSTVSEEVGPLADQVRDAAKRHYSLKIRGGNSKAFFGRRTMGRTLDVSNHAGVMDYQPTELVVTARGGTPMRDLEALLAKENQMLAFEPPDFGQGGTVGGMVATGFAGPSRPFVGGVRDYVLGVTILDGQGQVLRFGGTVFKNVAGFDLFRLMAGAMGSLGVLLDVSLRVTPRPRAQRSLSFAEKWPEAQARLIELMGKPLPLSGAFHDGERLYIRLSGTERAVAHAGTLIGGDETPLDIWQELRHHRLPIFHSHRVWRLSTPRTSEVAHIEGQVLIDWAGAQRWLATRAPARSIRQAARDAGGYATLFQGVVDGEDVFEQMPPPLFRVHQRLKRALDPSGVFNRSRVYDGF